MARNKPFREKPAEEQNGAAARFSVSGEPGGRSLEPATRNEAGELVPLSMPPLIDPAPVVGSVLPYDPPPEPPPVRYVVEEGGNVIIDGHVVNLRKGKVLDGRSFSIGKLVDHPTIKLRLLEGG